MSTTRDPAPRDGLKLKPADSITGAACCPACGGLLTSPAPIRCPRCAHPLSGVVHDRRKPAGGHGLGSALAALLGGVVRFVLLLVLVALVAVGGTLAYQRWWQGAKREAPAIAPAVSPCAACQGTGEVRCSLCGGSGRVDGVLVHDPCEQCGGTGLYQHKLRKGAFRCPFCRGTGSKGSHQSSKACLDCEGKGFVSCAVCGGTGRKTDAAPPQS